MSAHQFVEVAPWYDELMASVPYEDWVRYVENLVRRFGADVHKVLDLACGTGRVSAIFAERGYSVVGVDISPSMIEVARSKRQLNGIRYYCQPMQQLSLGERFDLVICLFDSINYVTEPADVRATFLRVHDHLRPGGLFVFDINAQAAFELDLFTQSSFGPGRRLHYSWRASYDPSTRLCSVDMRFMANKDGKRQEFTERHLQRCYDVDELVSYLAHANLTCLATLDAYTMRPAHRHSDRVFFVARREKEDV
jgi:SAM-dependent methyltransferase